MTASKSKKSRTLTIYLLKDGVKADTAFVEGVTLRADNIYIPDGNTSPPWWKNYLQITDNLNQENHSALYYLEVDNRSYVVSFGHAFHSIKDTAYEYDFGIKTTLNSITDKLKSIDTLAPATSKRTREQIPLNASISEFGMDLNELIVKNLVGEIKENYRIYFSQITGTASVRITTKYQKDRLSILCKKLFEIYQDNSYKERFPEVDNITPVNDPTILETLKGKLLEAISFKNENLILIVPQLVDYEKCESFSYYGNQKSDFFTEVNITHFFEYIKDQEVTTENLKKYKLVINDENDRKINEYSIEKCLIFDTTIDDKNYHLNEGKWYCVNQDYLAPISKNINDAYKQYDLTSYNHKSENSYNKEQNGICLDCANISPNGKTQVEPCDIYQEIDNVGVLFHIKISTRSSLLSHLFNQGYTSVYLLKSEKSSVSKLTKLIDEEKNTNHSSTPINENKYEIVYGIITKKMPTDENYANKLPLFSQITLDRLIKNFKVLGTNAHWFFIQDEQLQENKQKRPVEKKQKSKKSKAL